MKTKDAQKRQPQNKPKPFKPDFMIEVDRDKDIEQHTTEDIRDILSKPRG